MNKKSYPNEFGNIPAKQKYNTEEWVKAWKQINDTMIQYHVSKSEALNRVTNGWQPMEKRDFEYWLKFYGTSEHKKYITAAYVSEIPGYYLPTAGNNQLQTPFNEPNTAPSVDSLVGQNPDKTQEDLQSANDVSNIRKKILSRLDSAAKALRSDEGHKLTGGEYRKILQQIQALIAEISSVNRKLSNKTYSDLIIKRANVLQTSGLNKSASYLYKLAEDVKTDAAKPTAPTSTTPKPEATKPEVPKVPETTPSASLMAPPANVPEAPPTTNSNSKPADQKSKSGLSGFVSAVTQSDVLDSDDDELEVEAQVEYNKLYSYAQVAQTAPQLPPSDSIEIAEPILPAPSVPEAQTELKSMEGPLEDRDYNSIIDSAFKNITVQDVIKHLEVINYIFKKREISRQLAIADVMLDTLGISSFFPSLAEATNKVLESNQYCLSRVEDVISKLRGSLASDEVSSLNQEESRLSPNAELVKSKLEDAEQKERGRKELKKKIENESLEQKLKPEPVVQNVSEDLTPEELQPMPPAPIQPQIPRMPTAPIKS